MTKINKNGEFMKLLLISILALGSISAFASCPDINGIYACTGLDKADLGRVVKVMTKTTSEGMTEVHFNNQVFMSDGENGVYCHNNTLKDSQRSLHKIDDEQFEIALSWKTGQVTRKASSNCVRLK